MTVSVDPPGSEALLSPAQVAHICGLSRRPVHDAIGRGELQAFRLCARLRISTEQLADWLRRSVAQSSPSLVPDSPRMTPAAVARRGSFRAKLAASADDTE